MDRFIPIEKQQVPEDERTCCFLFESCEGFGALLH